MKTSPGILIVVALFAFIASNAPTKAQARTSPMCANFVEVWRGLPRPVAHLRFAGAALVFELGYRSLDAGSATIAQPVTLRLIVTQSGRAKISILSHKLRLAFPHRSA